MRLALHLLPIALLAPAHADVAAASALLRQGDAAAALTETGEETGPAADFLRGRALLALGRPEQAVAPLQRIPAEHPLFPYAAKALLYAAWQSPSVDVDATLSALPDCGREDIATLASAALAEYRLDRDDPAAESVMQRLRESAEKDEALRPLLQMLEIADLRRKGEYETAITHCRRMERDRTLSPMVRHRLRLLLADVYYAQEAEAARTQQIPADDEEDEDIPFAVAEREQPVARGRGEETLLHFISSLPESPLLDEAFRRLMKHEAFTSSETARARLKEWGNDMRFPRRAALALQLQQRLLTPEDATDTPPDAACVNTAAAALPREPRTDTMLLEQVRFLLLRGQTTEAALYLASVQQPSPRRDFLAACLISDPAKAAKEFISIARRADSALQGPAWNNALLCALRAQDPELLSAFSREQHLPESVHQELSVLTAAYQSEFLPDAAQSALPKLLKEPLPAALHRELLADAAMVQLKHPEMPTLISEDDLCTALPESLEDEATYLRLIALAEAMKKQDGQAEQVPAFIARTAADTRRRPHLHAILTLHLSHLLSESGQHHAALRVLQQYIDDNPRAELTPRARMLAARQAELIGSLSSLKRAAELYGICAEENASGAERASIRQAAVLIRIGKEEEAEQILQALRRREETLSAEDRVLTYAVLANLLAMRGTPESLQAAVHACSEMLAEPSLPPRWQALSLLHHGMICTRADKHDLALGDYLAVLRMKPTDENALPEQEWRTLYQAAAGAAYEYINSGRFEEAAQMAEQAAAWHPKGGTNLQEISARFARWAQNLRKTHFLAPQS